MAEEMCFKPRKVTDPNDRLDEDGYLCVRGLFNHSQAIAHKVECHDKSANTDGYIELVDDEERPIGKLIVQAKTYKSKYKGMSRTRRVRHDRDYIAFTTPAVVKDVVQERPHRQRVVIRAVPWDSWILTENGQKPSQKPSNMTENDDGKQRNSP